MINPSTFGWIDKFFNKHEHDFVDYQSNSVLFYNDSKATNPEASIPALKSINSATHLIAGGMDKESDYSIVHSTMLEKMYDAGLIS